MPDLLNRRTAASLVAPHSKAALTERRLAMLGDTEPTHDGTVRLRPPRGLVARTHKGTLDLGAVADIVGEVAIPERAFMQGLLLLGEIRAVLLVENLGTWRDLPTPEGWLCAHVPGWDTATVMRLLDTVAHVPIVHFGDLDPNGVRILLHLRERRPDLMWFVPPFWAELIPTHGLKAAWPDELDVRDTPSLVQDLAARGLWLEQEPLAIDARVGPALTALLGA